MMTVWKHYSTHAISGIDQRLRNLLFGDEIPELNYNFNWSIFDNVHSKPLLLLLHHIQEQRFYFAFPFVGVGKLLPHRMDGQFS